MVDVDEICIMGDSLYLPKFLRCLGAHLGKGVEIGGTPQLVADLLSIDEGGFVASSVALAWPVVYGGYVHFSSLTIGKKAFVGNISLVPGGKNIGDAGLLATLSIPPEHNGSAVAGSAWLGSPAVFLPKREMFTGYSDEQTYTPSKKLYAERLIIEFFRIILPSSLSFISFYNLLYILDFMISNYTWQSAVLVVPFAELFITRSSSFL